jgi:hypothetical protein
MISPTWHARLEELRDFLKFWGPLQDDTRSGDEKKTWKADLRRQLDTRDDKTLDAFAARMQARYDEIETTRGSIATRANSLLLFVGVLTTGAGLIAQALVGAPWPLVALFVFFGALLLYSTLAAAVLAVRAQLVSNWDVPWINHADATDERAVKVIYAVEILVAVEQNKVRVRRPVAFLRDGQKYAIAAIAFIAVLAALSVAAAMLRPPTYAADPGASPVPSALAVPPSPSPTTAPSPSVIVTPFAPASSPSPPAAASPSG